MKNYELMTVIDIDLKESGALDVANSIKDAIAALGGSIKNADKWGKRKFAYAIDNKTEGYYEVLTFEVSGAKVESLKKNLNLTKGLVRYLITQIESK